MAASATQNWPKMHLLWSRLDRLYLYSGYLAAFCMVSIFAITMLQIVGRAVGFNPRGLTDYAGYFMAASAFLGMAYTFAKGGHVRIELFLGMMGRFRIFAEWFSFLATSVVVTWLAFYAWSEIYWSFALNDISTNQDATPLWIPQLSMGLGLTIFAIAVIDHGLRLVLTGQSGVGAAPIAH
jgi:TRAP-type C4-dicarboxylate transport system permease small subunit